MSSRINGRRVNVSVLTTSHPSSAARRISRCIAGRFLYWRMAETPASSSYHLAITFPFLLAREGVLDEPNPSPAFADRGPTFWRLQIVDLRLCVALNLSPQRARKPIQALNLRLYAVTGVV